LKYLKATSSFGICFTRDAAVNILTTYYDVDYVVDLNDHRSRTSFVLLMNGGLVAWGSWKQPCCSSSTTEAEYIVRATVTKEVIWLHRLLGSLGFSQGASTNIFSDNQS
jgi:hypothetical protein